MVRPVLVGAAMLGAWLAAAPGARAQLVFQAVLNGAQEPPSGTGSAGTGYGRVVLNAAQTQADWFLNYQGLGSLATLAHFHQGAPGVSGGVVKNIFTGPGTLPTSGSFTGTWSTSDPSQPLTPALVTALTTGQLYFNVHSQTFGAGEIRGQIVPVPEPGSMALAGLAFGGLLAYGRRRRALALAASA